MEVKVCKNCRKLFKYILGPELCPDCVKLASETHNDVADSKQTTIAKLLIKEEDSKFEQVKEYIKTHPAATVTQIAQANDVLPAKLFSWIRDERLEFSNASRYAWFNCEKCGAKINSGRFCHRCKTR